jgi:23S rRNA (adenine2030-N6)-methyltransferase
LLACELEPNAARALTHNLAGDERVKVVAIDGWTALVAYVPPKERRGVVIIDPAFEKPDDTARLADRFAAAYRKWASGIYLLWYPIKQRHAPDALARELKRLAIPRILCAEITVAAPCELDRLTGCGLVIANPPWTLERELAVLLPALTTVLARDGSAAARLDWLAGEK